jgi:hypothetical protein
MFKISLPMKHQQHEIIDKALHQITAQHEAGHDYIEVNVDFEDEGIRQAYVVSFRRESDGGEWTAQNIREAGEE